MQNKKGKCLLVNCSQRNIGSFVNGVLFYLLWPMCFNVVGRLPTLSASAKNAYRISYADLLGASPAVIELPSLSPFVQPVKSVPG
jgi:hypothetical protein